MDTGTGIASTSDTMEQSDRELMSGNARRRDEEGRFSSDQNDRLSITGNQYEELHEGMNQDLSNREVNEEKSDVHKQPTESEVLASEGYTMPPKTDENHDAQKEYFGENNANEKVSTLGEYMSPTARAAYEISLTGHVDNVDDVFSAMREKIERANDKDKTTNLSPRPVPTPEEADILENIDNRLKEITDKLDDNAKQLANIELTSDLSNSELITLISKQNQLFSTQTALMNERFSIILEKQNAQIRTYIDNMPNNIQPTPVPEPTPAAPEFITVPPIPSADPEGQELEGEDTWEQTSADYTRQLAELDKILDTRPLTNEERIEYFNLERERRYIDQNIIAPEQQESERERERKEKIIKIVAGVAGAGIALATPAVGVAAIIAVTLGGRYIGKGLKRWSENLRNESNAMKYEDRREKTKEELDEMDNKQKRKAWWADRLGEASAVVIGGSVGYGIGAAIQNITGWQIGSKASAVEGLGATNTDGQSAPPTQPPVEPPSQPPLDSGAGPTPPTDIGGGATPAGEGLGNVEWFKASDYQWDSQKMGWLGDNVSVGPKGGPNGLLQKRFFGELTELVPKNKLMGQASGDIVNSYLRNAYRGVDPIQAAQGAADALLGQ
ncbi:MAG: hypothetical protein WC175_01475 [Candidatus Dojkabacteria bacterium]|jgi:hypothetical protein